MSTINVSNPLPLFLFTYGTLMRGYGNHRFLNEEDGTCNHIGKAKTIKPYAMFASGVPFVNPNIERTHIYGEVYRINTEEALNALDRLEGHPDWYVRTTIDVELIEFDEDFVRCDANPTISARRIKADIYFNSLVDDSPASIADAIFVESGNFRDMKNGYN